MKNIFTEESVNAAMQMTKLYHEETDFRRIPLEVEEEMLSIIREGRYEDFIVQPFEKIRENHGTIIPSELTSYVYIVVSAVALFSRTAVRAGVTPDDAFDLADALLLHLSACTSLEEVRQIFELSGVMFAKQVRQKKAEGEKHSWQTAKIQTYISRNIFRKIILADIAAYTGLSKSRISHLFAAELGISVHDYIQREKIAEACRLLVNTDRPVAEIAAYLGFASPGNFAVVFRKWQKMSPREFRTKAYREVY